MTSASAKEHFQSTGLYDPANEHDACGVGFVATAGMRDLGQAQCHAISQASTLTLDSMASLCTKVGHSPSNWLAGGMP